MHSSFISFFISVKSQIIAALKDGDYLRCMLLFTAAREEWPTDPAFVCSIPMQLDDEEDEGERKNQEVIKCIRNLFFGWCGLAC